MREVDEKNKKLEYDKALMECKNEIKSMKSSYSKQKQVINAEENEKINEIVESIRELESKKHELEKKRLELSFFKRKEKKIFVEQIEEILNQISSLQEEECVIGEKYKKEIALIEAKEEKELEKVKSAFDKKCRRYILTKIERLIIQTLGDDEQVWTLNEIRESNDELVILSYTDLEKALCNLEKYGYAHSTSVKGVKYYEVLAHISKYYRF